MTINLDIPSILKQRRKEANKTQKEVADLIGKSTSVYGSYEEGRATPDIHLLIIIARVLGYNSLDVFLDNEVSYPCVSPIEKKYFQASNDKKKIVDFILNIK